jgi:hypothetical protein
MGRGLLTGLAMLAGSVCLASSPCSALPLDPDPAYAEPLSVFRQPLHPSPFVAARSGRFSQVRAFAAARRRAQNLPACTTISVTFPADVGQPANAPTNLTAALVDPAKAQGPIDATGCDIGIYFDSSANNMLVRDVQIHDADQFGILAVGAKRITIENATIFRIGNHDSSGFDPNGVQTGVGIDFESATGNINEAFITQYQKNGTAFDFGANVDIANSSVIGLGSVNYIAQNGVQWYESLVRGSANVLATANHYDNPNDPVYNGQATGFLVLCTNEKSSAVELLGSEAFDNDYNYYISNNTTNGDCPPGYKT